VPCYSPVRAWRDTSRNIAFKPIPDSSQIQLPCGRCIGCRLERSRQWAVRLVHEKAHHEESSFITLTYDEDHLPEGGTLVPKHFQDFVKRLRRSVEPRRIRFFHAGEYGERRGRPHYHAIIFGEAFRSARTEVEVSDRGDETWSDGHLTSLWPFGRSRVGEVTFESCAYVARYVTKKITGAKASSHYQKCDPRTGEVFELRPEYATMSRRPGIGRLHIEKYFREVYSPARDSVICRGRPAKPPRYYDKFLEQCDPQVYARVKEDRESALLGSANRTDEQRRISEAVKLAQLGTFLSRRYEIG